MDVYLSNLAHGTHPSKRKEIGNTLPTAQSHSSVRDGASRHAVILAAGSLVEALPNW